jgi:hypothetical protein
MNEYKDEFMLMSTFNYLNKSNFNNSVFILYKTYHLLTFSVTNVCDCLIVKPVQYSPIAHQHSFVYMFYMYCLYFVVCDFVYSTLFIITLNRHCMSTYAFLRQSPPEPCFFHNLLYIIFLCIFSL